MPHNVTYAYIGWDEFFGTQPPPDGLEYYFRHLPRRWLILTLGQISTTLFNSGQYFFNPKQQIGFVLSLKKHLPYYERLVRFIGGQEHRVLLHPAIVSSLVKYALLYGSANEAVPPYAFDHLIRAITIMNDKYGKAHGTRNRPEGPLMFLDYELESMLASHENFSFVIARYYRFMKWAESEGQAEEEYLPVADDFAQFFGMTYEEYAAAAFGLFTAFLQPHTLDQWHRQIGALDVETLTATLSDKRHFATLLAMLSIGPEAAIERLSQARATFSLSDLRPFIDKPLLSLGESIFACPYQGFFRNRLGPGLYFALFDKYRERDGRDHLEFSQFFGRFLEHYLYELIVDGARSAPDVMVFPEQRYKTPRGESRSSDIVIIVGDLAVFMDVTRKRFKLDQTLCEHDRASLAEDIDQAFVTKAKQIHDSIADFKKGMYQLGSISPTTIKRYLPVIITEQDLPQIIALPHLIHSAVRDAGWLQEYETLQLLAAEDVEAVYMSAGSTGTLAGILQRKAASETHRGRDLASYLYDFEQAVLRADDEHSLPGYRDFFDTIVMPKMYEWGLRAAEAP